jgi:hypothetical protein
MFTQKAYAPRTTRGLAATRGPSSGQQTINARPVDAESLSNCRSAHARGLHCAHLRHVYRGWPPSAFGLSPELLAILGGG